MEIKQATCAFCNKDTDFILVDTTDGISVAFCSWDCLSQWVISTKSIRPAYTSVKPITYSRGAYRRTVEAIPIITSLRKEGKSIRDIAQETKVSPNTVKSLLNPDTKINTLGATSKVLRFIIACANQSMADLETIIGEAIVANNPDEVYYDITSAEGIIATINEWLNKLDTIDDTPHARGAVIALTQLIQYLALVEKLGKKVYGD
jgi:hypothetical protein